MRSYSFFSSLMLFVGLLYLGYFAIDRPLEDCTIFNIPISFSEFIIFPLNSLFFLISSSLSLATVYSSFLVLACSFASSYIWLFNTVSFLELSDSIDCLEVMDFKLLTYFFNLAFSRVSFCTWEIKLELWSLTFSISSRVTLMLGSTCSSLLI